MTDTATTARRLPLLSTMAYDLNEHRSLRTTTAAAMWAAYTTHTALTGWALIRRVGPLSVTEQPVSPLPPLVTTGAGLCDAGMSRFTGAQELTGTRNEPLRTTAV